MKKVCTVADSPKGDGKKDKYPSKNRAAFAFQARSQGLIRGFSSERCTQGPTTPPCRPKGGSSSQSRIVEHPSSPYGWQEAQTINHEFLREGLYAAPHCWQAVNNDISEISKTFEMCEHLGTTILPLPCTPLLYEGLALDVGP